MKLFRIALLLILLACLAVVINLFTIPDHNTTATHFDTLIVLGNPTTTKGNPSATQRSRVLEAVSEYKAGIAPAIIFTGGAAHNQFVEAHTMAMLAATEGVPASAIFEEPQALNTIQNLYYSTQIMHAHGWSSAEVISSAPHLGRAALILEDLARTYPALAIQWKAHPAPWPPGYYFTQKVSNITLEAARCLELRIFGFPKSSFLPKG